VPAQAANPDALLCERCGYAIAGLSEHHPCPECGQPAGQSWPDKRPGTYYQTRRRLPGLALRANLQVLRSPGRTFRQARIDPSSCSRLLYINLMLTAGLVTAGFISVANEWLVYAMVLWIGSFTGMLLLTYIETLGLRFFGRADSRKWRITKDVAWTVCDHASVGWLLGGLLMLTVWLTDPAGHLTTWEWGNTQCRKLLGSSFNDYFITLRIAQMTLPLLAGMLAFETLVYLGIRQCRYANTPASASQQGPVPTL